MKTFIVNIAFIFLLAGCAAHSGYLTDSAALGSNNFDYVQQSLKGEARASYILGIGGLSRQALLMEAKENLLFGQELRSSQTLANITVNWKSTFFLIGWTNKCIVTADIVEFR